MPPQPTVSVAKGVNRYTRSLTKNGLLATLAVVVLIGLGFGLKTILHKEPPISPAIQKQVSFGIYFPTEKAVYKVDKKTIDYNVQQALLTYSIYLTNGTKVIVNQQATPESFVDIPQAYDKFVTALQSYSSFESVNGKVSLTHPSELHGSQSAVLNGKGTLLFASPSKSMSKEDLQKLFNNLQILR